MPLVTKVISLSCAKEEDAIENQRKLFYDQFKLGWHPFALRDRRDPFELPFLDIYFQKEISDRDIRSSELGWTEKLETQFGLTEISKPRRKNRIERGKVT